MVSKEYDGVSHNTLKRTPHVPKIALIGISDKDMELPGKGDPGLRNRYGQS